MATCSAPIYDVAGYYSGCITVDIYLDAIQNMVSGISLGKNSAPILLDSAGVYLYAVDSENAGVYSSERHPDCRAVYRRGGNLPDDGNSLDHPEARFRSPSGNGDHIPAGAQKGTGIPGQQEHPFLDLSV